MTDLHCHILPGIDDGAKTVNDSIKLLQMELNQGVNAVVFTPHFDIRETSIAPFIQKRAESYSTLVNYKDFNTLGLSTKLGAEVFFSVDLIDTDLTDLCIEDTEYVIIELPVTAKPVGLTNALSAVINNGFTPILAHVERYPYITENPQILYNLVSNGCLAQVNAYTVNNNRRLAKIVYKYIKWGLVQIISSDCHSVEKRPPNTAQACRILENNLGKEYLNWMKKNSNKIFDGKFVDLPVLYKPQKFFGIWR